MIHSNHEVKPHRARLVLPWGTRWEARVTNVFALQTKIMNDFKPKVLHAIRGSWLLLYVTKQLASEFV